MPFFRFVHHHNTAHMMSRESPSTSGITNAASLAAIGSVLVAPSPLLTEQGRAAAYANRTRDFDGISHSWTTFTQAGFACWDEAWGAISGWCGWHGIGGQLFLFNPAQQVVFAYLTTGFGVLPPWQDPRGRALLEALQRDLPALNEPHGA